MGLGNVGRVSFNVALWGRGVWLNLTAELVANPKGRIEGPEAFKIALL